MSIFDGVEDIINGHLFFDPNHLRFKYHQKRSCQALSEFCPSRVDGIELVAALYQRIQKNLAGEAYRPSSRNWVLRPFDMINSPSSSDNKSSEVNLERAIAERWQGTWFYQTPVASGLIGRYADKRRAIDLVCRTDDECFDFIELKTEANTPLFAAFEILLYGLAYLVARQDAGRLLDASNVSLPLMAARQISLVVLAPDQYYEDIELAWLEKKLKEGLSALVTAQNVQRLTMDFRFEQFPPELAKCCQASELPESFPRNRAYSF